MAKDTMNLKPYLLERVDRIMSWSAKSAHAMSMEDIHTLRVDIKQIIILFGFLKEVNPKCPVGKFEKSFRSVFRLAGSLREQQLHLIMLRESRNVAIPEIYWHDRNREIEETLVCLLMQLTTKWQKGILKTLKKSKPYIKRVDIGKSERKLTSLRKSIRERLLSDNFHPNELHTIRKEIKKQYYLGKIFSPARPQDKTADQFQELLGLWHDQRVIGKDLQHNRKQYKKNPSLKPILQSLSDDARRKERMLFDQIMTDRHAYLKTMETA